MSAIAALYNRDGAPIDPLLPQRMLDARPERGPHGSSIVVEGNVALVHQHFWLLPEEQGEEQPLQEKQLLLSADLRLDNRQELGTLLELTAAELGAASDAQLLLLSYRLWGEKCLDYILGDFAFALWDGHKRHLFCARDALGARDLCYYQTDGIFLAASEISQLLAHPAVEAQINERRVASFLISLWDDQEETFFEDIQYLPPAHALIVTVQEMRQWRYWDIDEGVVIRYNEEADYVEQYRSILAEAVRVRMRSSGPIAVSLSGGLDSSALAVLADPVLPQTSQKKMHSFSYAFDELSDCDERRYIRPIVERYQIEAQYIPCDDRWTLKNLSEWPVSRDFVLADPFAGLPDAVMKAAQKAGVRLLLTGYYGDTLAGGSQFWALDMLRDGRYSLLAATLRNYSSRRLWKDFVIDKGLRQLIPDSLIRSYRNKRPRSTVLIAPGIHPRLVELGDLEQRLSNRAGREKYQTPGFGHRYQALNTSSFSQGLAATRHQYNQYGLEVALPYFDRRLVEFIMAVPAYVLGRPGYSRLLQRQAMIDYLPESVWQRQGRTTFKPLMVKGLRDKESDTVRQILSNAQIVERQYVRGDWLQEQLQVPYKSSIEGTFLWNCIALELWLKRFWS
jgi:asparagine synthase (glutamine-hydrolysing)